MTAVERANGQLAVRESGKIDGSFGLRLRRLRLGQALTMQQVAERSGLAASTISKVENNQISPSYENLLRLADGLGVDVAELFNQQSNAMASGRRSVTRRGEGVKHDSPQYDYEMLCADLSKKHFIPLITVIKGRPTGTPPELLRHAGEEFVYVLSGSVDVYTDQYKPLSLTSGDSCYFDSNMGHALVSTSEEEAQVIWVCSRVTAPLSE